MGRRDIIQMLRFISLASAPAMVSVMALAYAGLLPRGIARIDVLVLLVVGLLATFAAWATSSSTRRGG